MFRAKNIRVNFKKVFKITQLCHGHLIVILHQTSIEFHDHPIHATLGLRFVHSTCIGVVSRI